jgi:Zn-dependent membrane protease YugP
MFFDPLYLVLIVATLVISGGAQMYIRSTYGRWGQVPNSAGLTGAQVAAHLRDNARFGDIREGAGGGGRLGMHAITAIKVSEGELSDHFDPRDRSLALSPAVASQPSVASMAIAAHEVGHAQQVAEGSGLMKIRGVLVPAASLGPTVGYVLIFAGLIFQMTGLLTLGIIFFAIAVLFSVLTLPVELQASQKAIAMLESTGIIRTAQDRDGAKSMLRAAALTYLAAAVTAVLTLLYYLSLARRSS